MPNYSVSASQLIEGSLVLVRGKLGFARLTRLIEGAELAASDARRMQNGMNAVKVPHTTATVTETEVVYKDAANPTVEERFVAERRYASKKRPETGANYSIDSKGRSLPVIAIPNGEGQVVQDTSGQELAQGLDVTLVLRAYKPKDYSNRGLSLDQVIVNEPVRYYGGNVSTDELAARGIVFASPPQALQAGQGTATGDAAPTETGESHGTVVDENGFAMPSPTAVQTQEPAAASSASAAHPQAAAPLAAPASAAAQEESLESKLARLEAENSALKDAGSPIGAPGSVWDDQGQSRQAGITYQK